MCIYICTCICVCEYFEKTGKKFTLWQMNHSLSEHEQNAIRKGSNFTQISLNYEQQVFYALDSITVFVLEIQCYAFCTAAGYWDRLLRWVFTAGYCARLMQHVTVLSVVTAASIVSLLQVLISQPLHAIMTHEYYP